MYASPPPDSATLAATEAFLSGVQHLSAPQWKSVVGRSQALGEDLSRDDLIRGAVVAITVRHVLPGAHFALLYGPFSEVIPLGSLFPPQPGE